MSDPSRGGYTCHGPMQPMPWEWNDEVPAYVCVECLKWRHGFAVGDVRRLHVAAWMQGYTDALWVTRQQRKRQEPA